jgi:CheY-like chemotaxis protein
MIFARRKRSIVRLLVVEDEPLVAFDTEHLLTGEDYEIVATVDRVADAVAVIGDGADIHLVLVDVLLADGSGIEVARAAQARGIPAMFVTGNCPGEAEAFAAGCLSKPYAPRDLLAAIAAIEAAQTGKRPRRLPNGFRLFAIPPATAGSARAVG